MPRHKKQSDDHKRKPGYYLPLYRLVHWKISKRWERNKQFIKATAKKTHKKFCALKILF